MSLFWRNFLLLAGLLTLTVLAWFQALRTLEQEPRALQSAQALASLVNLTRAALIYTDPIARVALVKTLVDEENVRIAVRDPADEHRPFPAGTLGARVAQALQDKLGPGTIVAREVNGFDGLWIGFAIEDEKYWLLADPSRLAGVQGRTWLVWGATALGLSLLGAVLITRVINQPLQRLAHAARRVGEGDFDGARLDEDQPTREIASVNHAFNAMAARLARAEADRRLMLAGISHDLRTPLARLRLEIELGVPDAATRARMADDVAEVDTILGQFLDFARERPLRTEPVVLGLALERALAVYRARDDVLLTVRCPPEARVRADATLLHRILINLLENAVRHGRSADGLVRLDIEVQLAAAGSEGLVAVHVRDHGPGVPPELLPRLSEPFFRAEAARTTPGSGLGLAIVHRGIERMGGRLTLALADGGGLRITLHLPAA
ncbi:MAG: ATP-binding protein [Tepidimonas sp.]|uniref:ATP-binding protein n=1 Tax=Tepidimonas sp. TaxID=2002775 RepID=UPI00298F24A5|nr:ATP-binding protein [Tepidimonas sp.]MCX7742184.1 ATP-binding protein [Tepidimonas sp.]MDW8336791.1 ATP-binding protein [Tepidimonas sp.]